MFANRSRAEFFFSFFPLPIITYLHFLIGKSHSTWSEWIDFEKPHAHSNHQSKQKKIDIRTFWKKKPLNFLFKMGRKFGVSFINRQRFLPPHRYTRNLVDAGNGKFNLMILCWGEGHGSAIHDHSKSHCFMKMLKGELCETRYAWPTQEENNNIENSADKKVWRSTDAKNVDSNGNELQVLSQSTMETNAVHYINGKRLRCRRRARVTR